IDYPAGGEAQIAETVYGDRRLIVRRTRLLGAQAELFPDWRHSVWTLAVAPPWTLEVAPPRVGCCCR
ncbi:MAG: hypothetical protein M3Q52_02575, partial [Pseudomonadota bacterium]|nr:hypothetical protein [Pseudomonadota bacterium]